MELDQTTRPSEIDIVDAFGRRSCVPNEGYDCEVLSSQIRWSHTTSVSTIHDHDERSYDYTS
jgi:hypothetical protein